MGRAKAEVCSGCHQKPNKVGPLVTGKCHACHLLYMREYRRLHPTVYESRIPVVGQRFDVYLRQRGGAFPHRQVLGPFLCTGREGPVIVCLSRAWSDSRGVSHQYECRYRVSQYSFRILVR